MYYSEMHILDKSAHRTVKMLMSTLYICFVSGRSNEQGTDISYLY
jgi:hypothetical protein